MLEMRCMFRTEPPAPAANVGGAVTRTRFFLMLSKRTFPPTSARAASIAAISKDVLQRFDEHASQRDVHITGHFAFLAVPETPYELQEGELGYTCVVEYPLVPTVEVTRDDEQAHPLAVQGVVSEAQVSVCVQAVSTGDECHQSRRD